MAGNGRIWRTSEKGIVLNDASRDLIQPPFSAVLADTLATCIQHSESDLHSIYITGSIPRGLAVPGASDINVFGVLEHEVDPELVMQDWIPLAEEKLLKTHASVVTDVQIDLLPQGYIFRDPDEFSIGAFIIVTHAVCMWGSDLTPELPFYNLNDHKTRLGIANDDIVQLMPDINDTWERIEADASPDNVHVWCKHICKNMVRTGFSLVMDEAQVHTRDIDVALAYFSRYYPDRADDMAQAAQYTRQPLTDVNLLMDFLDQHGEWMLDRCEAWLDEYNPERLECFFTGDDDAD